MTASERDERDQRAAARDHDADERDRAAKKRDVVDHGLDGDARDRDESADQRDDSARGPEQAIREDLRAAEVRADEESRRRSGRQPGAGSWDGVEQAIVDREVAIDRLEESRDGTRELLDETGKEREQAADDRSASRQDRAHAAESRLSASEDRRAAAADRDAAAADRAQSEIDRNLTAPDYPQPTLDGTRSPLASLRSGRSHEEDQWLSLTAAEVRIAGLVASGMTNRAVAERLFVSRHTVDAHLKHIYAKLGIHCRVELTVLALQHGAPLA